MSQAPPQLYRPLQRRAREAFRRAVVNGRSGEAPPARLGDRQETAGGRGAPDHLSHPTRNLPAAAAQGADHHGQQPIQWLAYGRRVARPLGCVRRVMVSQRGLHSRPEDGDLTLPTKAQSLESLMPLRRHRGYSVSAISEPAASLSASARF